MLAFFQTFNLVRIIRLGFGSYLLTDGILHHDFFFGSIGTLLLIQGIFNVGCSAGTCAPSQQNVTADESQEITFEEVK